jgi:hypothetical protein
MENGRMPKATPEPYTAQRLRETAKQLERIAHEIAGLADRFDAELAPQGVDSVTVQQAAPLRFMLNKDTSIWAKLRSFKRSAEEAIDIKTREIVCKAFEADQGKPDAKKRPPKR